MLVSISRSQQDAVWEVWRGGGLKLTAVGMAPDGRLVVAEDMRVTAWNVWYVCAEPKGSRYVRREGVVKRRMK